MPDSNRPIMGEIKITDPEVIEVERRLLGKITETNADLASLKGDMKSVREAQTVVLSRIQEQGETLAKMADKGRLTFAGVIAAILAGIGIMQYIDQPSDDEREQNRKRIEKLEDAAVLVATSRYTRQDHDAFADKVAEEIAEVEGRSIDRKRELTETVERRLMHLDEHVESLREELHNHQKDGHPNSVLARVAELESRLRDIHAELGERGEWMRQTDIERASLAATNAARIEEMQRQLREISAEQRRRTSKVYDEAP